MRGKGKTAKELELKVRGFYYEDNQDSWFSRFTPSYTFDYLAFGRLINTGLYKNLEELRKYLKEATGYYWDNNVFRFSNIYGTEFAFSINLDKNGDTITVFSATSDHNLRNWQIAPGVVDEILKTADMFTMGKCLCSLCREEMKLVDIAGAYYGGRFCKRCWEEGYKRSESMKAVEARESYN